MVSVTNESLSLTIGSITILSSSLIGIPTESPSFEQEVSTKNATLN